MLNQHNASAGKVLDLEALQGDSLNKPLVTIITAVLNAEATLEKCIQSVLNQDYSQIEYIILDGGSTDRTIEIIRKYEDRISRWISERDAGVFDAWNKGIDFARGEWIGFLGADDEYLPGAISEYMSLANAYPGADFLSSRARLDHPTGYSPVFGGKWEWPRFSKAMTTVHVGTLHRKNLFEQYGRFDPAYKIAGDYEFMLRSGNNLKAAFTPAITVVMSAGGLSDSTASFYEARRAKLKNKVRHALLAELDLRLGILRFWIRRFIIRMLFRLRRLRR